jgi:hypothetical protein
VSEISGAAARVTKITLRDHPKRADGRERPRFGSVQRVVAVATVHQFAVVTMWQVEIANEHISRIDSAIIVPVARITATPKELGVAAPDLIVRVFDEPAAATSERKARIFAIVNAIISRSRIDIARIEIAGHGAPPSVADTNKSDARYPDYRRSSELSQLTVGRFRALWDAHGSRAELMRRTFGFESLACPRCGGRLPP